MNGGSIGMGLNPLSGPSFSFMPPIDECPEPRATDSLGSCSPFDALAPEDGMRALLQQMSRVEQQLAVLSVNTQWSLDHVFEHMAEVKKAVTPRDRSPSSSVGGTTCSFPPNSSTPDVAQLVERLEKSVKEACGTLQDSGGSHAKIATVVQELSTKLSALEMVTNRTRTVGSQSTSFSEAVVVKGTVESVDLIPVHEAAETGGTPRSPPLPKTLTPPAAEAEEKRAGGVVPLEQSAQYFVDWMEANAEVFHWKVFFVELVVQLGYYTFGILSIPLAYLVYGNTVALENRAFFPGRKFNAFVIMQLLAGLMLVALIVIWLLYGQFNGETDPVEMFMVITGLMLRCIVIGQKYAYMPAPVYNMFNKVKLPFAKVQDTLLIAAWLDITDERIEKSIRTALLTFLGPIHDQTPHLHFIEPPKTREELMIPSRLQGKMTRSMVAEVLVNGEMQPFSDTWKHLDLSFDLMPTSEDTPPTAKDGGVELIEFFQFLVKVVLRHEKRTIIRRYYILLPIFVLVSCTIPGFSRLYVHGTFFGNTWSGLAITVLSIPVMMLHWLSFMSFVYVATLDLLRRRTLVCCLCALLSNRIEDRRNVPKPIRAMGILDLREPQCIDALRSLRELCFLWGKNFSIRCTRVLEVNIAGSGIFVAMFLFCTENAMYDVISQLLVFGVVYMSFLQLFTIILSSVIGQSVNDATARCVYLLHHHRTAMSMAMRLRQCEGFGDRLADAAESIEVVAENMQLEQETNPTSIFGMKMGIGLLSSLYMVAALVGQRFAAYCATEPHMCLLDAVE